MRRFFWKIFAWFWLTVLVIGAALAGSLEYSSKLVQRRWATLAASIFPQAAPAAAAAFESGGLAALQAYTSGLTERYPIQRALLFTGDARPLSESGADAETIEMAQLADGDRMQVQGGWAGQRVRSGGGRDYVLVLEQRGTAKLRALIPIVTLPAVVAIAGGLFCLILSIYVTGPIHVLRAAAGRIAEGRLDTRISALHLPMQRIELKKWNEPNEIAALSRDFDFMAERLEALVAGQRRLLGEASHELRSPLARLTVALGLARQQPEQTAEHLERIGIEANRLDKLVGQLLTLSRIESRVDATTAPVDLANLVQEVAGDADFEARAQSKRVEVTSAAACVMPGSEELLRSAIENIVRNAVRHTAVGTSVEISVECAASAVIRVRDHGPGVAAERLAEIFQPFRHSDDGAGLGLAIADRAVRAHGGSISATNGQGGGLLVEITIPRR